MRTTKIISARRSAVVPRGGAFAHLNLHDLSTPVLLAALEDAQIMKTQVDEVILSNALGAGGNPARLLALNAELPETIGGLSIDRQCVGGLDALLIGDALIRSGQCEVVVAGGAESYSRRPIRSRTFVDGRAPEVYDQAPFTPWPQRDPNMADAAADLGKLQGISRHQQDHWAIKSHQNALAAPKDHIVEILGISDDPFTRRLSMGLCQRAKAISGDITAANMAVAADGAGFVVMTSDVFARKHGLSGLDLIGGVTLGGNPMLPGLAPIHAIRRALSSFDFNPRDLTHIELMEAFAVQAIACQTGADLPIGRINPWGGALARGHPVGASGAILAVNLFHQLRNGGLGLASIAAAGGLGSALLMQS